MEVGEDSLGRTVECRACGRPVVASPAGYDGIYRTDEGMPDEAIGAPGGVAEAGPAHRAGGRLPADLPAARMPRVARRPWAILLIVGAALLLGCAGAGVFVLAVCSGGKTVVDKAKEDAARAAINGTLVPAVERYRVDQVNNPAGELPESLQDLVDDPKISLKPDQLIDPWGRPYHYSLQSQHGNDYDIWVVTPDGKWIGNWKD
jgi:hypothetical protein